MHILGLVSRLRGTRATIMRWPGLCLLLGLITALPIAAPAWADTCSGVIQPNMIKQGATSASGQQDDLEVTGKCIINQAGNYYFGQVNIYSGGSLTFAEPTTANTQVNFWASSIIVEYNSALIVGKPGGNGYGANGGFLNIYLYGSDLSKGMDPAKVQGQGVLCKTPTNATTAPCGIPVSVWSNNGKSVIPGCGTAALTGQNCIPGLPSTVSDYFYQYGPLYGDGKCTTSTPTVPVVFVNGKCGNASADGLVGYFGYKTLAVSFGGSLFLNGYKGIPTTNVDATHTNAGVSWIRLAKDLTPGQTTLTLVTPSSSTDSTAVADRWWRAGDKSPPPNSTNLDQIVVTTSDYLPRHTETFTITSIAADGVTVNFSPAAKFLHRGTTFPIASRLGTATQ
ncbi:MAG TPA: hypothetical protein VGR45_06120, partial [Stellaceae bacterium]|nr:hypothetical protein [Stellaceae bacterium]